MARKKKKLFEVDSETLFHAAVEFFSLRQEGLLFLNVFPSTLLQRKFLNFFEKFLTHPAIWGKRVVLEINEGEAVAETKQMQQVINYLRMNGVRVAIDDVGKGAATLQNVIELEPEYLKLDRYFAKGLSTSANKQKLIGALVEYCRNQTHLVLEGIEQPEDLAVAKLLGIQIAQGYLLGRPEELIDQRCVTTQTDMSAN
ncbi:EAL domain-containing protein (putative c-di-GMP-specific phosphodiesterase class I) [Brevibacillus fulvus]|uniref:EAL domain-containing protein (Putative c-di-GMP-specific phosphodiesterase class I) n=1 Tax=Brevibacillus fulvus TaxID=1125967 RepID=A0A938XY09_9BACL|nr:EAL domain-containing protein (putative c-di-GMP-specific phosphodiesterase class I) [Brevibacillus fulvus]